MEIRGVQQTLFLAVLFLDKILLLLVGKCHEQH